MDYLNKTYKIGAVVVVYNQTIELLDKCIQSLVDQVDEVCIVDNSTCDNSMHIHKYGNNVLYIPLRMNKGIAAAQNVGIRYFRDNGYDFVLFSDQDSSSPQNLVAKLLEAYCTLSVNNIISCIGPMPVNRKTGKPYIYHQCIIDECEESGFCFNKMHSIISSYSLVPMKNFSEVGLMNERLFIDFVEQDWCWRAAAYHNMMCVMIPSVKIEHELGVSSSFLGHNINVSSTFRIYYQTRNLLWLCRKSYVPSYWKKMNLKKIIVKFFYYSIVPKKRFSYCGRMLRGIVDGIFTHL